MARVCTYGWPASVISIRAILLPIGMDVRVLRPPPDPGRLIAPPATLLARPAWFRQRPAPPLQPQRPHRLSAAIVGYPDRGLL